MAAIKMDKEQLHRELEALKEREKATHAVVHFYTLEINMPNSLDQRVLLSEGNSKSQKLPMMYFSSICPLSALTGISLQVEHLQREVSQQYLLYRDERDARKLLIRHLNDLKGLSLTEEHAGDEKLGRSGSSSELALSSRMNGNCIYNAPNIQLAAV